MTEIGNVTVRVDAIITDEQYREAMSAVRAANERMDLLEAENAKLRELVLTLYMCSNIRCGRCKYGHGNTCDFDAENELRELGVEVNE